MWMVLFCSVKQSYKYFPLRTSMAHISNNLTSYSLTQVQDIALTIFAQRNLPGEIRMLASVILLETKPSLALISTLTGLLLQETDIQVTSFVYTQLRGIAMSRIPDNNYL